MFTDDPAPVTERLEELGVRAVDKDVYGPEPFDSNCHLVIAVDQLKNAGLVRNAVSSVKAGGCLLLIESDKPTEQRLKSTGLEPVASLRSANNKTFVLLRKVSSDVRRKPFMIVSGELCNRNVFLSAERGCRTGRSADSCELHRRRFRLGRDFPTGVPTGPAGQQAGAFGQPRCRTVRFVGFRQLRSSGGAKWKRAKVFNNANVTSSFTRMS